MKSKLEYHLTAAQLSKPTVAIQIACLSLLLLSLIRIVKILTSS